MDIVHARDYSRIRYYVDAMGQIWHGAFSRDSNLHYKRVNSEAVSHTYLPREAVEITPYQAAQYIKRMQEIG